MIGIKNLTSNQIDEDWVKKIIDRILEEEGAGKEIELSVVFVGPGRIRRINRQYRKKNRVTDVLSFSGKEFFLEKKKRIRNLGEIVICLKEVKKNSQRFSRSFREELYLCLAHGLLHLLGYNHVKKAEAEEMQKKQEYYSSKISK